MTALLGPSSVHIGINCKIACQHVLNNANKTIEKGKVSSVNTQLFFTLKADIYQWRK